MIKPISFQVFGEHAVLVNWASCIDTDVHAAVVALDGLIVTNYGEQIEETVITYHSLAIYLSQDINPNDFIEILKVAFSKNKTKEIDETTYLLHIPVCYEDEFALDLKHVANTHKISQEEVVHFHTMPMYKVYFLGFLPGFPYLGGLNPSLHTPRRENPRPKVAQGAVGIGGEQTGIYPLESPGGWNIIGRSPLVFFDPKKTSPTILKAGDYVKFSAISKEEFLHTKFLIEKGIYLLNKEPYHD